MSIVGFRLGRLQPAWRSREELLGTIHDHDPTNTPGTIDHILGFSDDGSLYQFTLLSDAAWRFLRFVQNLACRSSKVYPSGKGNSLQMHIEPRSTPPHMKHVDGDILARLVNLGPGVMLELLQAEPVTPREGKAPVDYDSPAARYARFEVLLSDLLCVRTENPVEASMIYLRTLLEPIF